MPSKTGLSQEALKLVACVSMLLDHIGAALLPWLPLRMIGRLAFPIYCFLLAEGAAHTHSPRRYALRLAVGALLSELPFDLLFYGGFTWAHQSVMVTLLLSFGMAQCLKRLQRGWSKAAVILLFALAAELLRTDYGALGILFAALFLLTREKPNRIPIQIAGLAFLGFIFAGYIQVLGAAAMIPISLYSGKKQSASRALQWAFYLFYPVHLTILAVIAWGMG